MKRMLSLLLTICLLTALMPAALGEEESALRVLDGWWAAERYQEAYPDRKLEVLDQFNANGTSRVEEILRSGEWDAVCFDTDEFSLSELESLGLAYDLNANAATAAVGARLYPSILAGCSANGKLVALPAGFIGTRAVSYQLLGTDYLGDEDAEGAALRDQLGFTADDQPTNFAEMCALGLRYMALSREQRKGTTFLSFEVPQGFLLLYNLILAYQTEATDENGQIDFDTPAFREALATADPLLDAFAADPKATYDAKGNMHVVLWDNIGVTQSYGSFLHVAGEDVIPAFMTVVVVNPNSPHLEEANDFALIANEANNTEYAMVWYKDADYDALLAQSYDNDIAAQIEQGEDQSVIDRLEAMKAAGDDSYFIPKRVIEHYATQIMPRLVFRRWFSFSMDDIIFDHLDGVTDVDGLIQALNAAAKE